MQNPIRCHDHNCPEKFHRSKLGIVDPELETVKQDSINFHRVSWYIWNSGCGTGYTGVWIFECRLEILYVQSGIMYCGSRSGVPNTSSGILNPSSIMAISRLHPVQDQSSGIWKMAISTFKMRLFKVLCQSKPCVFWSGDLEFEVAEPTCWVPELRHRPEIWEFRSRIWYPESWVQAREFRIRVLL